MRARRTNMQSVSSIEANSRARPGGRLRQTHSAGAARRSVRRRQRRTLADRRLRRHHAARADRHKDHARHLYDVLDQITARDTSVARAKNGARSFGAGGGAAREDVGALAHGASLTARRRDRTGGMAPVDTRRGFGFTPSGGFGATPTSVAQTREAPGERQSQDDEEVRGEPHRSNIQ